jgi:hypothetical protein
MEYTNEEYINCDPFDGEMDVDIRCKTVKIVKTRKKHPCHISSFDGSEGHEVPKGSLARVEKALVDGDFWRAYYCCLPCLRKMLNEEHGIGTFKSRDEFPYPCCDCVHLDINNKENVSDCGVGHETSNRHCDDFEPSDD